MTTVRIYKIGKAEKDRVLFHEGDAGLRVKFADDWAMTKEERAAGFHALESRWAAIPVDRPFQVGIDFLPSHLEGCERVILLPLPIASVESL